MNVGELIEQLKKYDPNLSVKVEQYEVVQYSEYTSDSYAVMKDISQLNQEMEYTQSGKKKKEVILIKQEL